MGVREHVAILAAVVGPLRQECLDPVAWLGVGVGVRVRVGVGAAGAQLGVGLAARRRNIGDFGRASRPHRGLPSGPERLNGSSRARSAAGSLESQPREARIASCGATEVV